MADMLSLTSAKKVSRDWSLHVYNRDREAALSSSRGKKVTLLIDPRNPYACAREICCRNFFYFLVSTRGDCPRNDAGKGKLR